MRRRLLALVCGVLVAGSLTAPPAQASGCVTRSEYRRIHTNQTQTPITVGGIVGADGRIVSTYTLGAVVMTVIDYRGCRKQKGWPKKATVRVTYIGQGGPHWRPATAAAKTVRRAR